MLLFHYGIWRLGPLDFCDWSNLFEDRVFRIIWSWIGQATLSLKFFQSADRTRPDNQSSWRRNIRQEWIANHCKTRQYSSLPRESILWTWRRILACRRPIGGFFCYIYLIYTFFSELNLINIFPVGWGKNEHICATALYYYSNENIKDSNPRFPTAVFYHGCDWYQLSTGLVPRLAPSHFSVANQEDQPEDYNSYRKRWKLRER